MTSQNKSRKVTQNNYNILHYKGPNGNASNIISIPYPYWYNYFKLQVTKWAYS